jgi:peptidoglycan/xylan/chitin deacetylase (PgdA/CDA1 family)
MRTEEIALRSLRLAASMFSPAGARGRLSVLIYHRVLARPDAMFPEQIDAARFAEQMELLARRFNVLPLAEAVERLQSNSLNARSACITFDDGYADNYTIALPILRRHGLTATFFIAAGFLDGGLMWNDKVIEALRNCTEPVLDLTEMNLGVHPLATTALRRSGTDALLGALKYREPSARERAAIQIARIAHADLGASPMLAGWQVRALHEAGMEIGGHTVNHPILTRLTAQDAKREIVTGKALLESLIGARVSLFAYPNGKPGKDYGPEHVAMVRQAGFAAAVSTAWGAARSSSDIFQIARFTPWDPRPARFMLQLLRNYAVKTVTA